MDTFQGRMFEPITLHKYLYANADSINMIDPSGQFGISQLTAATGVRAVLVNSAIGSVFGVVDAALGSDPTGRDLLRAAGTGAAAGAILGPVARIRALQKPLAILFGGLGVGGAIDSARQGNHAQAAFRGITGVLGSYLFLRASTTPSRAVLPNFRNFGAQQGFSGVWHPRSGVMVIRPSHNVRFEPPPAGFLPRNGGHAIIARTDFVGVPRSQLWGFTAILQSNGSLRLTFNSGINPGLAPASVQPVIATMVRSVTGKTVTF